MITVSLDDFLYNYCLINKGVDRVLIRDMMEIRMMVSEYNSNQNKFDEMIDFDFYQDDFQCVHLDFELSSDENAMVKKKKPMTYDDNTIINYMKLPQIVTESIKLHTRHKKIKRLRNKIYKEKTL